MAERIKAASDDAGVRAIIDDQDFPKKSTDERFVTLLDGLAPKTVAAARTHQVFKDASGRRVARFEETEERFTLSIDRRVEPDFGAYLRDQLPELLAAFRRKRPNRNRNANRKEARHRKKKRPPEPSPECPHSRLSKCRKSHLAVHRRAFRRRFGERLTFAVPQTAMNHLTTPFGRRPLTAAQIDVQTSAAACQNGSTVDKWAVVRNIASAREQLGLGDRAIAILNAPVSFHLETELETGEGVRLVVFSSNVKIHQRAHGIAEATLRRHTSALVEAGIMIRRVGPNGKRYARRAQSGSVSEAFGFDLTTMVARCAEFDERAWRIATADRAERLLRERVSILRRDLRKLIERAEGAGTAGPWTELSEQLAKLTAEFPRRPSGEVVAAMTPKASGITIVQNPNLLESEWPPRKESMGPSGLLDRRPAFRLTRCRRFWRPAPTSSTTRAEG